MSIKISSGILIVTIFVFVSCASQPATQAPWDASPAAMRQVFPDSEYIAQRGRGAARAAAEADGVAQIARYFNTQISSQISITERETVQNGNANAETEIASETFVRSQMELFGIRYAADAYF